MARHPGLIDRAMLAGAYCAEPAPVHAVGARMEAHRSRLELVHSHQLHIN
jgi:hypothetical protein